jgi:hypothetical protein
LLSSQYDIGYVAAAPQVPAPLHISIEIQQFDYKEMMCLLCFFALCLQGSQAYAKALAKAGILTQEESETIVAGLDKVRVKQTARHAACIWGRLTTIICALRAMYMHTTKMSICLIAVLTAV